MADSRERCARRPPSAIAAAKNPRMEMVSVTPPAKTRIPLRNQGSAKTHQSRARRAPHPVAAQSRDPKGATDVDLSSGVDAGGGRGGDAGTEDGMGGAPGTDEGEPPVVTTSGLVYAESMGAERSPLPSS